MRITVLAYLDQPGKPPDAAVTQVAAALKAGGHDVELVAEHGDLRRLIAAVEASKPDLVFNLVEMFGEDVFADYTVAGLLDLLEVPYTGADAAGLLLTGDKVLSKKILAFEGIACPRFAVFTRAADLEMAGHMHMPLFVKPLRCDSSIGIDARSLVHDTHELMRRVRMIHEKVGDDALVEEYVDGRELYVGLLGNHEPQVLPIVEMDFSGLPASHPPFLDYEAKFARRSRAYRGTKPVLAELGAELRARLQQIAVAAFRAVRARDYGRVDLRVTPAGEIYVLEVNANCYLEQADEYPLAAAAADIAYPALIQRIVDLAMARYPKDAKAA